MTMNQLLVAAFQAALSFSCFNQKVVAEPCYEAYSCANSSILTNGTENVECYGFYSCNSATLLGVLDDASIYCHGSYSCYDVQNISHFGSSVAEPIQCYGLYSCANVKWIHNGDGDMSCSGEQSCINTNIYVNNGNMWCYGDRSCVNAVIYSNKNNFARGHLAAQNATFFATGTNVYYHFYGSQSGKNATVVCGIGHTCTVDCAGDGCVELTLLCDITDPTNTDCTFDILCDYAEYSVNICPNGYKLSSFMYEMPNLLDTIMSSINNSNDKNGCSLDNTLNGLNYQEYESSSALTDIIVPICCTASYSCDLATNITTINQVINDSDWTSNNHIRCDGAYSCNKISNYIMAKYGANIYLTATFANSDSTIFSTISAYNSDIVSIYNDNNDDMYNIYCTSYDSCANNYIINGNNLYCNGNLACSSGTIDNFSNVWAFAHRSARFTKISNIGNNVYCGTHSACYQSSINNVENDVYGKGYHSLYNSEISNCNSVLAFGIQALVNGRVTNCTNVYCDATESCQNVTIRSVQNIRANGNNVLAGATIISEIYESQVANEEDRQLIIYINGSDYDNSSNVNDFSIYCNSSNTCKIDCESNYACTNLYLYCNDNCYVKCDESNGIDCPAHGNYSEWVTSKKHKNEGLSEAVIIVLIIIGCLLAIIIIAIIVVKVILPKRKKEGKNYNQNGARDYGSTKLIPNDGNAS